MEMTTHKPHFDPGENDETQRKTDRHETEPGETKW